MKQIVYLGPGRARDYDGVDKPILFDYGHPPIWFNALRDYETHISTLKEIEVVGEQSHWVVGQVYSEGVDYKIQKFGENHETVFLIPTKQEPNPEDYTVRGPHDQLDFDGASYEDAQRMKQEEKQGKESGMINVPQKIYLQIGDGVETDGEDFKELNTEYITWCEDSINDNDIPYVHERQLSAAQATIADLEKKINPWHGTKKGDILKGDLLGTYNQMQKDYARLQELEAKTKEQELMLIQFFSANNCTEDEQKKLKAFLFALRHNDIDLIILERIIKKYSHLL